MELENLLPSEWCTDKEVYKSDYKTEHRFKWEKDSVVFIVKQSNHGIIAYFTTKTEADRYAMQLARYIVNNFTKENPANKYIIEYDSSYSEIRIGCQSRILWTFYDTPCNLATIKIKKVAKASEILV